jgi:leader peptidase (prepilin peptidase) / N-methyltransferase
MGEAAACACVLAWSAALCVYDIRERRLPNWLTVPGAVVIVVVAFATGHGMPSATGAIALTGLYLVVHLIAPSAMGAGDVKLAMGLGGLTGAFGYDVWVLAAVAAPLFTGMLACFALALARRQTSVPHGPSMCLATLLATTLAVAPV